MVKAQTMAPRALGHSGSQKAAPACTCTWLPRSWDSNTSQDPRLGIFLEPNLKEEDSNPYGMNLWLLDLRIVSGPFCTHQRVRDPQEHASKILSRGVFLFESLASRPSSRTDPPAVQGCLAHKNPPPPLGQSYDPRYSPTVGS